MDWITSPDALAGLLALVVLEIILGIDNIVFISILAGKLPQAQQARARQVGLGLALVMRIAMLFAISWVIRLTAPLFMLAGQEISGRDLILIVGGLFLLAKATHEIHDKLEGDSGHAGARIPPSFGAVILQIVLLDAVFSIDSVITAVGMVSEVGIMVIAVTVAMVIMLLSAARISDFVNRHPTVKMLALSFLLLIGLTLVAEGLDQHIPKGYIYFAIAFSIFVEMLNLRLRKVQKPPLQLNRPYVEQD
ncbi:MAG: TerC family protein [Anaerolineaceae bacterium]|nr:TerC family protein [Anaerolineaceae bacterium]